MPNVIVKCSWCNREYSEDLKKCPYCGFDELNPLDKDYSSEIWLVCGSRNRQNKKIYPKIVHDELSKILSAYREYRGENWKPKLIIQGECPDGADIPAKKWAEDNQIPVRGFPAVKGRHLYRNINMVKQLKQSDEIIALWDGFSYGTAHTIAQGILQKKSVTVFDLKNHFAEVSKKMQ